MKGSYCEEEYRKLGCNQVVHNLDEVENTGIKGFLNNNKTIPGAKKLSSFSNNFWFCSPLLNNQLLSHVEVG